MSRFAALLRGVNLGGKNQVRMAELARLFEGLSFTHVKTYLASGNVIFMSERSAADAIASDIASQIQHELGMDLTVLVRDDAFFQNLLDNNPFLEQDDVDRKHLYVTFLEGSPDAGKWKRLVAPPGETARFALRGDVVYLYCPDGYGRTKLSNAFFERKLGMPATTRNWNTVRTLAQLLEDQPI